MTEQLLLDQFETLTEAPNGITKLRELILQLAVQGKLVPQNSDDESASILLERIKAEKERLIKEGKIRKPKPLPSIEPDGIPNSLLASWEWVRLGEIGDWGAGATPDRKNPEYYGGSIDWFKSGELKDGYISESEEKITELAFRECSLRLNKPGDVLIAMYGATIGKVALLKVEATTNQAVCACTCFDGFFNRYLLSFLKAHKGYFSSRGAGGAQPNISKEKIIHTLVALPPLEEQKRIVAKVDQLMALCDELEEKRSRKKETKLKLNRAALNGLTSTSIKEELTTNLHSLRDSFMFLYDTPETIPELRQAILQLAVQGKLVPQDPTDQPVQSVLKDVDRKRQKLYNDKRVRALRPLRCVKINDHLFLTPQSWTWHRFGQLAEVVGGVTKGRKLASRKTAWFPYLRVANVQRGFLDLTEMKEIEIPLNELDKYRLEVGDLLITEGGDWDKVGRTAIWQGEIGLCLHQNHVFRARLLDARLDHQWIMLFINSSLGRGYFGDASKQTTNLASINMTQLRNCPIPLPPLEEQKRIVVKVDQLMALCDELEDKLKQSTNQTQKLLESIVWNFAQTRER